MASQSLPVSSIFVSKGIDLDGTFAVKSTQARKARKARVSQLAQKAENGMQLKTIEISKTVKTLTGDEIERKGKVQFPLPESLEEAQSLYGENLWKWAVQGASIHLRVTGSNAIAGGDPKLKALRRQFTQSFETLTKIMELGKDDAIKMLLSKETFKPLIDEIEALKNADKPVDIVFSAGSIPEPRWFTGEGDADEDVTDNTPEVATTA